MPDQDTTEGQAPEATENDTPETVTTEQAQEAPAQGGKFDQAYVKSLRAEAAKHRKEAAAAKSRLQEIEDAEKTELEKLSDRLSRTEKSEAEARTQLLRYEVAAEKAVPPDLVTLLNGDSRESLEAQADLIVSRVTEARAEATPSFDGGPREATPEPVDPDQAHNSLIAQLLGTRN